MSTQFQEYARRDAGGGALQQRGHAVHQRAGAAEGGKRGRRGRRAPPHPPPLRPVAGLPPPCLSTCRLLCCFGIPSLSHVSVQVFAAPSNIFGPGKEEKWCVSPLKQWLVTNAHPTLHSEGFAKCPSGMFQYRISD